ncbi:MAG: ion transporter [Candidatus Marinimicrobia bacterium]|nr:ion transporter [Candidatus Neomarinimicrobiota bacterium]
MKKETLSKIGFFIGIYFLLVYLLVLFEQNVDNSSIQTIWDAVWYSIVTLTTVGYGDYYPISNYGKLIGIIFVIASMGLLLGLVSKVTEHFSMINERKKMGHYGTDFSNHIIILGWNNFGAGVVLQLVNASNKVVIITDEKKDIDRIYEKFSKEFVFVIYSDLKNIKSLEKGNVTSCHMVFINLLNDSDKLITTLNIKKEYPDVEFLVTLDHSDLDSTFHSAGVNYVLSKDEIASKMIASFIFEPDVAEITNELISSASNEDEFDVQQYLVTDENPFINKTYGEAFESLKKSYNVILIGLSQWEGKNRKLLKFPKDNIKILKNNYLILISDGITGNKMEDLFKVSEGVAGN